MASLILAGKIMSLLLILFVGFLIVRLGILSSEDARVVSRLTIYAVTPCTIITSYQVSFTPDIRDALLVTLAAGVITQMFYTFISLFYTKLLKLDEVEHAAIVYSNSLNLIVPLVSALLGPQWVIYASMYSSFQTFMMWSNGKSILCGERRPDFRKVFKNINIISVFIGIFIMILGITEFPGPIQSAMNSLGSLVGAMGMLNMGMIIGGMELREIFTYKRTPLMCFMRLIVMPIPAVLFLKFGPMAAMAADGKQLMLIVLLAACGPTAVNITQMAQLYGRDAKYASAIGVVSTLLCIITMPLMIALYNL
ncbi:MAG: AEC family transporter [Firmicutes bacterium]|nr:AEC family transporter [Bacillota bacterium]